MPLAAQQFSRCSRNPSVTPGVGVSLRVVKSRVPREAIPQPGDCFAALPMTGFGNTGCGFVIARLPGRGNLRIWNARRVQLVHTSSLSAFFAVNFPYQGQIHPHRLRNIPAKAKKLRNTAVPQHGNNNCFLARRSVFLDRGPLNG
jgi:hypothetical protein